MLLQTVTPAQGLAISLADARLHLRVDHNDEDALISSMIVAATEAAGHLMGRPVLATTLRRTHEAAPAGALCIACPGIAAVQSVEMWLPGAPDPAWQAVATTPAVIDELRGAYLQPLSTDGWPSPAPGTFTWRATYSAGWATPADVPESARRWIALRLTDLYEQRSNWAASAVRAESTYHDALLAPWRTHPV